MKAAQVASSQEFLNLLEKSGLLTEEQLAEVRSLAGQNDDAKAVARQLIGRSYITKWQATQLLNGFGQFAVGKYRLLDQLGIGRLGREFLAEHVQLGRRVALKLVARGLTGNPKRLKTFLAEFRRAGALDHPHLVHSHDVDQEGQRFYVVTEYVDGENLRQRVERKGTVPVAEALGLAKQAAEGLAFAAAAGVIHGDLKPTNLLVDAAGVLKVSDLGFARLVDVNPTEVASRDSKEQNLGDSREFSAPESLNQVEGDMDARADIYSLGQILYFLLTGQASATPESTLEDRRKSLLEKRPQLPAEIASLYARFTSPNAADRPASWTEALEALNGLATSIQPDAEPSPAEAVVVEVAPTAKRKPPVAQAIAITADDASNGDAVVVELAEPQPFVIDTKSSSPRGKAAAKKATPAAVAPTDVENQAATEAGATSEKPSEKTSTGAKQLNPKLVLGGVIGGGVLLLLIGVGVVLALLGGGQKEAEKQVAKAPPAAKKSGKKPDTSSAKSPPADVGSAKVSAEDVNPTSLTSAETAPALEAKTEPVPATSEATSAGDSGMPPMPAAKKPAEPSPAPSPSPPAEPKPETPAPAPADAPKPEAPKTEPPKIEPAKPEPPKSEPAKPAAPAPKASPFEKLPKVVDLPALSPDQPAAATVLGEINVSPEQLVTVLLYGGEEAARGKQVFTLQNANGTDLRNWEVGLSGKSGEESIVVAKFHLDQNKFSFAWTPEAAQQAAAPHLANCLLKMSAGKDVTTLALRKPVETEEPVTLDMEKGSTLRLAVDHTPDPKKVRVELVGLNPVMFPNPEFTPESTVEAAKGTMYVWVGDAPEKRGLGVRVDTADRGKNIEVRFQPHFRLDPQTPPAKVTKKLLPDLAARLEQSMAALTAQSAAVQASNLPKDRKDQAKTAFDQEQTKAKEQRERVLSAIELHKRMHEAAVVHVRVSYATEGGMVVLAQTKGAPPPADPKPAK